MYTASKKIITSVLFLIFFVGNAQAQTTSPARNFVGLHAGIGWSTFSLGNGASYERIIFSKKNKELGAKFSHTSRYKYGNLSLFYSEFAGLSRADLKLTVSGYLYTNKLKSNTGFFILGELGTVTAFWKERSSSATQLLPVAELGIGWKWPIGDRMCIRWTNSIVNSIPAPWQPYTLGVVTSSTFALGF